MKLTEQEIRIIIHAMDRQLSYDVPFIWNLKVKLKKELKKIEKLNKQ